MSSENARVVVVGSGILGGAVAYALASQGEKDVIVLEAESDYDQHSTGRSAAYYIPMYESVAFAVLSKASLGFLKSPPEGFSQTPIFRRDGAVIAAVNGAEASVISEIAEARRLGLEVAKLEGAQIRELVPVVRTDKIGVAAYYPDAGEINVPALASGYRRAAKMASVRFITSRTYRGARLQKGRIVSAVTDKGEIGCEIIVNAAGAWVGEIAAASGATAIAPLVLRRHLLKARVSGVPQDARWPFFRCPSLPLYFKLSDGEVTFSPMDADPTPVGPCALDPKKVESTLATLNAFTDLTVNPQEVRAVAGHRIFGSDHQPLLGRDPQLNGFFWAGGMGGAGIMAAPAVGEVVSAEILNKPCSIDTSLSAVNRFSGRDRAFHWVDH
jgi:D-arginine dehydrogenase